MKRFLLCVLGAASVLASGGCARDREQPTGIFSSLYSGREDDVIQREIYLAAREKKPISHQTLDRMNSFFADRAGATEDCVKQYAEAQKEVYSRILQRESAEKLGRVGGIFILNTIKSRLDYGIQLPFLLDDLKTAHRSLDPAYEMLDETYQSITEELSK